MVQVIIHKMHRATGNLYPVLEGLLLRLEAGKRRQQRRMNIENAVRERGYKLRRQQPHITGQANQIHSVRAQAIDHLDVVLLALAPLGEKNLIRQPQFPRGLEAPGLGHVRDHHRNLHALQPSLADRPGNREKVRPAAREQDTQPDRIAVAAHRVEAHVYCTRRSPFTTRPITKNFSSARSNRVFARVNLAAGIAAISPTPMLKVRIISSCETWPNARR